MNEIILPPVSIAGRSHHETNSIALESFRFPDEKDLLSVARDRFRGTALLQTCNRVELIVHGDVPSLVTFLQDTGREEFSLYTGIDALRHLLEVACGIDSLIVGEDQILGQMKTSLLAAQTAGTADHIIEMCMTKAIHTGSEVRRKTAINRGAVSVGSAAVRLAEQELGSLEGRHILVIGSGEMGMLVAQALAVKHLTAIYVANRTFSRAETLARKIGGRAVRMTDLTRYLTLSDVVISCTSAPHPVIRMEELTRVMKARCWPLDGHPRPLILVDIAQPRDVEEGAESIDGVNLFSIDNLRRINDESLAMRRESAEQARNLIEQELGRFTRLLNSKAAGETLATLHRWAEQIRMRERDKAITRLNNPGVHEIQVIEDLSRVLASKLLADATLAIRSCAEAGDIPAAERLVAAITRGERVCFEQKEMGIPGPEP